MIEVFKNFWNKIFGKKQKLLSTTSQNVSDISESQSEVLAKREESTLKFDENTDVYSYLIGMIKSCDGYSEFEKSEIELEKTKEDMSNLMDEIGEKIKGKQG